MGKLQTIRLKDQEGYGKKMPPGYLGSILDRIGPLVSGAVLMAFEGRSASRGRKQKWFEAATDIRFVGVDSDGTDSLLRFENPCFGEAARDLYRQKELWVTKPPEIYTAFDVFDDLLADLSAKNEESDRYDNKLLERVSKFEKPIKAGLEVLSFENGQRNQNRAVLNQAIVDVSRRLSNQTPQPSRVRVLGRLDMVRYSTLSFGLILENGHEIRGVLVNENSLDKLKPLMNKQILVEGKGVFRPSGRLLRVDVEAFRDGTGENSIWSQEPTPIEQASQKKDTHKTQTSMSGVSAFFGTWPGDESEEDLLSAVRELD
ncbi:MAG: hypothetical protein NUW37_15525 [Planctomycetes bacterium]|nr:hypothetical protein [Planctomycetota bacterium]